MNPPPAWAANDFLWPTSLAGSGEPEGHPLRGRWASVGPVGSAWVPDTVCAAEGGLVSSCRGQPWRDARGMTVEGASERFRQVIILRGVTWSPRGIAGRLSGDRVKEEKQSTE